MRRPGKPNEPEEPLLFDLPLSGAEPDEEEEPPMRRRSSRRAPEPVDELPTEIPAPAPPRPSRMRPVAVPSSPHQAEEGRAAEEEEPTAPASEFASRGSRIAAGVADVVVHAAVAMVAFFGCRGLGVRPGLPEAPAAGVFLLAFSFLYIVLPLAFWGHTPGMAWAGITSRNRDGEPLTFDQTARRWLGAVLTLALAGLPILLAFGRRTLSDWISGSATYPLDDEAEPA
jgi:uncharacterized RDD family membrane protein YckC